MSEQSDPQLHVEFVLDESGKPIQVDDNVYRIQLSVEGAPPETGSVVYQLDPTYYRPVREKRRTPVDTRFVEETTTYGDYDLIARVRLPGRVQTLAVPISGALRETYKDQLANPAIATAIESIAKH